MEPFNKRLIRFIDNSPGEIVFTLVNSIQNIFIREITKAKEDGLVFITFLGTHAVMLTISEKMFGKTGIGGVKFFLKEFVDGDTDDLKFSEIADDIHLLRNSTAHEWLTSHGYQLGIDSKIPEGWRKEGDIIVINPNIYFEQFLNAFSVEGRIRDCWDKLPDEVKIRRKFFLVKDFLRLGDKDPISIEIKKLKKTATMSDIQEQVSIIKEMIKKKYQL